MPDDKHTPMPASETSGSERATSAQERLRGARVILAVTGSVAAYKSVLVLRQLTEAGADVRCLLTESATRFIGPETLSALSGHPVLSDMYERQGREPHVDWAQWADALAVVPTTAESLARFAGGHAGTLLDALVLCMRGPVLLAPAMHASMIENSAVQSNVTRLEQAGNIHFVGPEVGSLASGEIGPGRLSEPETIVAALADCLDRGDLNGRHLLVTAGPTVEDIDPVRYLSNRSSGKMGFALAERARARGARVSLIAGPVSLDTPRAVERLDVRSALEMQSAIAQVLGSSPVDAVVMAAAVGDYRARSIAGQKLKRTHETLSLALEANPDLLGELGRNRAGTAPLLIGFAVETADPATMLAEARRKLQSKRCDLIVLNSQLAFDADTSQVTLVEADRERVHPNMAKRDVADTILDWVETQL